MVCCQASLCSFSALHARRTAREMPTIRHQKEDGRLRKGRGITPVLFPSDRTSGIFAFCRGGSLPVSGLVTRGGFRPPGVQQDPSSLRLPESRRSVWTVSLVSPPNARPSEIKKRVFFERKGGREIVVLVGEFASGAAPERPSVGRKSYGRESQAWVGDSRSGISGPGICPWWQEPLVRADSGPGHVNASGESVRGLDGRVPKRSHRKDTSPARCAIKRGY
jgi:hypothetical protein